MTEEIRQGTKRHFDYMALLVASSAISALGLATDNVAVVVAAMLVSGCSGVSKDMAVKYQLHFNLLLTVFRFEK